MRKIYASILFLVILSSSCKKVTNTYITSSLDKEVIIEFPIWYWSSRSTTFETLPNYSYLIDFDKRDYVAVDSIVFIAGIRTDNPPNTVDVRLFNLTDNVEIANTNLSTTLSGGSTGTYDVLQTKNIFNSLPNKRFTLAIQLKSANGTSYGYVMEPYLKLRRK